MDEGGGEKDFASTYSTIKGTALVSASRDCNTSPRNPLQNTVSLPIVHNSSCKPFQHSESDYFVRKLFQKGKILLTHEPGIIVTMRQNSYRQLHCTILNASFIVLDFKKRTFWNTEINQRTNVTCCQLIQYGLNATIWWVHTRYPFKNKEHG